MVLGVSPWRVGGSPRWGGDALMGVGHIQQGHSPCLSPWVEGFNQKWVMLEGGEGLWGPTELLWGHQSARGLGTCVLMGPRYGKGAVPTAGDRGGGSSLRPSERFYRCGAKAPGCAKEGMPHVRSPRRVPICRPC